MSHRHSTVIYIVRHGETVGNVARIAYPPEQDLINENGKIQAEVLGDHLADVKFTKMYCSDYPRTVTTTELILKKNKNSNVIIQPRESVREVGIGIFEGGPYSGILKELILFINSGKPVSEFKSPEGESVAEVKNRCHIFFQDMCKELEASSVPETVLIVSHGGWIKIFMDYLNESKDVELLNWDDSCGKIMRNTAYFKLSMGIKTDAVFSRTPIEILETHVRSHLTEVDGTDSLTKALQTPEGKPLSGCFQV